MPDYVILCFRDRTSLPSRWSPNSWTTLPGRKPSLVLGTPPCQTGCAPSTANSSSVRHDCTVFALVIIICMYWLHCVCTHHHRYWLHCVCIHHHHHRQYVWIALCLHSSSSVCTDSIVFVLIIIDMYWLHCVFTHHQYVLIALCLYSSSSSVCTDFIVFALIICMYWLHCVCTHHHLYVLIAVVFALIIISMYW